MAKISPYGVEPGIVVNANDALPVFCVSEKLDIDIDLLTGSTIRRHDNAMRLR